jgi:hypothetical protein
MKKIMTCGVIACAMVAFVGCGKKEEPTVKSVTADAGSIVKKAEASANEAVKDAPAVPEVPKELPKK